MSAEWLLTGVCLFAMFAADPIASASAQGPELAIKGYDTVAYFKLGMAAKGSESFAFRWRDMTWQFSSQEHRDLFAAVTALFLRGMGVPLVGGGRPPVAVWFLIPLVFGASYAASVFATVRTYGWVATRAQNRSRPSTWRLSPYQPATGPTRLPRVWVDRWERSLQSCAAHGGTVWPLQAAAPATEEQISQTERRLGHAIPASLRAFFATHAAAVSMAWELGDTTGPAAEAPAGGFDIRLDALPALAGVMFNGDLGRIVAIAREDGKIRVDYDEREVEYESDEWDEISLAYATSIHKIQGSEYPVVVLPLHTSHYIMLYRSILYTAVTRGKKLVIVVGSHKALAMAIRNVRVEMRNTGLKEMLLRRWKMIAAVG